jgi:hypothetical protein
MKYKSLFFCLLLISCAARKNENTIAQKNREVKKVLIENGHAATDSSYSIRSFSISGDTLKIEVTYSGGCGTHTFDLYSNALLKKSLPPQVDVTLEHKSEKETCNKDVTELLLFDINPLKKPGNTKIVVNINSADNKASWEIR